MIGSDIDDVRRKVPTIDQNVVDLVSVYCGDLQMLRYWRLCWKVWPERYLQVLGMEISEYKQESIEVQHGK